MSDIEDFKINLDTYSNLNRNIDFEQYEKKLFEVINVLINEDISIRKKDFLGKPGGVVKLNFELPTIIIPDLHARIYFLKKVLELNLQGKTVLELLYDSKIQIVCVGDGFHSERRCKSRWDSAYKEYINNFDTHVNIDLEMNESLGLMELVMDLKIKFPTLFHFLKGNHENILNEDSDGNYPFGKFTCEGQIVKSWVNKFCGNGFLFKYSAFEKKLPLFAIGKNFLVSHAEPKHFYDIISLENCYNYNNIISDLTWTRNNQADEDSISRMIEEYIHKDFQNKAYYFIGHESIQELYRIGAKGKLIQLHNPDKCTIAYLKVNKEIDITKDIGEVDGENTF